jgi:serralysin
LRRTLVPGNISGQGGYIYEMLMQAASGKKLFVMRNIFLVLLLLVSIMGSAQKTLFCHANQHGFDNRDPEETRGCAPLDNNYHYWDVGKALHVKVLNGSKAMRQKIIQIAKQWEQYGNIKFLFVDSGQAQIRSRLQNDGYLSAMLGTMANIVPEDEANVLIDTSFFTSVPKMQAIILHMFGHILGFQHEVKVPDKGRQWNKGTINKYFYAFGWDAEQIGDRLIDPYSVPYSNGVIPDQLSVMNIPLPYEWTNEKPAKWNDVLSISDKRLIEVIYPFKTTKYPAASPSLLVTGFKNIKAIQSRNSILFYPEFEMYLINVQNFIMYVMIFDENGEIINDRNDEPLVISKRCSNLQDKTYIINKGSNELGFFLTLKQIPVKYKGKKMKVIFKIYQHDYLADTKLTYSSKPCDFVWNQ